MREKLSYKIKDYKTKKRINIEESINRISECNWNYISTISKKNSKSISSEYNVSGVGGYGLNLI